MNNNSLPMIGTGKDAVSVSERVTSALLAIHYALCDERDPDTKKALVVADGLKRSLSGAGITNAADLEPALGLPSWLVDRFKSQDNGYIYDLLSALEGGDTPNKIVEDLVIGLDTALCNIGPCSEIKPANVPPARALAAYSAGEEIPMDIGIPVVNPAYFERLTRVDIPVLDGINGVLCAADLEFEAGGGFRVIWPSFVEAADQEAIDRSFAEGMRRGFNAAEKLLKKLGHAPNNPPTLFLRNIEPPVTLTRGSVALPVAVETLRQTLMLPKPLCVVSGSIDRFGKVQPIDSEKLDHAKGKLQAVLDEGSFRRLVAVTKEDHELPGLDAVVAQEATLESIARKLWGEAFEDTVRAATNKKLKETGLAIGWGLASMPDEGDLFVRTSKADTLEELLLSAPEPAAFHIGGPACSGKTWLAYDITERFLRREDWTVNIFHFKGEDTSAESLVDSLHAISDLLHDAPKRLIVLDGIRYSDEVQDFLLNVSALPIELGAHILVIRQSDLSTDWSEPSGADIQSIFTPADLQGFVQRLALQFPDVLEERGVKPEAFCQEYAGTFENDAHQRGLANDLFWICETARSGRNLSGYHRFLTEELLDFERPALERLAYATLYGIGCEVELIAQLTSETCDRFRVRIGADGLARIGQTLAAQMVLWDPDSEKNHYYIEQQSGAPAILPILKHVIAPPDESPLVVSSARVGRLSFIVRQLARSWQTTLRLIFRGVRIGELWQPPLLPTLKDEVRTVLLAEDFVETPWDAARLALDLQDAVPTQERLTLIRNMARLLQREAAMRNPRFTCTTLQLCYQVATEHELDFHGETQVSDDNDQLRIQVFGLQREIASYWAGFLEECSRKELVKAACQRESNPEKRLRLISTMLQLHMPDVFWDAAAAIPTLRNGLSKMGGRKYRYLSDIRNLLATTQSQIEGNTEVHGNEHWDADIAAEYAALLAEIEDRCRHEGNAIRKKQTLETLQEFTGWMSLMLAIGGFDLLEDEEFIAEIFDELAQPATPREIINAIGNVYYQNITAATNIVKNSRLFRGTWLLSPDSGASLTDISDLLFGLERWNIDVLQSYLWRSDGTNLIGPNIPLAIELATRVRTEGDLRNCGRILRAAGAFDLLLAPDVSKGFAAVFLEHVSLEWLIERVDGEVRSALLFHLVLGLTQIEHPWLKELRVVLVKHLSSSIADGRFQQWAARLFVILLTDEVAATIFTEPLLAKGTFDANDIQDGMENAANVEALEAYHILGRMIPQIGKDFVKRNDPATYAQDLGETLAAPHRGEEALRAIQAAGKTYRQFDPIMAEKYVNNFSWDSLRTALRSAKFGSTANALSILAELNHEKTAELIRRDAGQEILGHKLRLALRTPQSAAAILFACDKVKRGLGRQLLKSKGRKYREILVKQVRGLQNPRTYAVTANMIETVQPGIGNHSATFFKLWIPRLNELRSPAALVEILKLLKKSFDQGKSRALPRAAESINARAIAARLKMRRAEEDLSFAASLAMLLSEAGKPDHGLVIAEALAEVDQLEKRLHESRFVDVLSLFNVLGVEAPRSLTARFEKHLIETGRRTWLIDPSAFWGAFGAYALARTDLKGQKWQAFGAPPPTLTLQIASATRVLAMSAHVEARWVKRILDDAWEEIGDKPEIVPREMRPLLYEMCVDGEIASKLEARLPDNDELLQIRPFTLSQSEHLTTLAVVLRQLTGARSFG